MSEAFYVLVFGYATDRVMDALGMDEDYRRRTGNSLYTVEAHIRYLRQAVLGDELTVTTSVVGSGAKKLHLAHEMHVGGELAATEELLGLHVGAGDKTVPFDGAVAAEIARALPGPDRHPPDWIGRAVQSGPAQSGAAQSNQGRS
nr:thioesterase family protein [Spelaeicoccus albus]